MTKRGEVTDIEGVFWLRRVVKANPWVWTFLGLAVPTGGFIGAGQSVAGWLAGPSIRAAVHASDSVGTKRIGEAEHRILDTLRDWRLADLENRQSYHAANTRPARVKDSNHPVARNGQ